MSGRDELLRDAIAVLGPDRIAYRERALAEARALIEAKLGAFDEDDLRLLMQIYNRDLVDGRELGNRFVTGLVGQNANLLVGRLTNVNAILPQLWAADDAWIKQHLGELRDGGALPGGGWLFPTMVLHTREPARRLPMTTKLVQALPLLDLKPAARVRTGADYLRYCERVQELLRETGISPVASDALLFAAYRHKRASTGANAVDDDEDAPVAANPRSNAPAAAPVTTRASVPAGIKMAAATSVAAPTATGKVGPVGWLHLTDLHQGMGGTNWLWPNVAAQAFADLERLHEVSGPWELVFFTGDLTQSGTAEEFKRLDETLERLWRHLERLGSRPRLVAVPGNHDLQWLDQVEPVALALLQWHDNRKLQEHVLGDGNNPYRERLGRAFANFVHWSQREAPWFSSEGLTRGLMPGDMSLSLALHGLDIGIVGLNSAFLQLTGANYHERLHLHPRQLHEVCGHYAPEWLQRHHINLLLTHHPPEWLEPRARQEFRNEIDVAGRFAAHFFGHMHEGTATSVAMGGSQARHAIQGASLFGLEEYEGRDGRRVHRIHGYSAGRFEPVQTEGGVITHARVRIFPRRMFETAGGRRIDRDVGGYELDERGSLSYEVPVKRRA